MLLQGTHPMFEGFHPTHEQLPLDARPSQWTDLQADLNTLTQLLVDAQNLHGTTFHGKRRLQEISIACTSPEQHRCIASVLAVVEQELADKVRLSSSLQDAVLDSRDVLGAYIKGMPTLHQQHEQQMKRTEGEDRTFGKGPYLWQPPTMDMAGGFLIPRGDDRPGNMSPSDFSDTTLQTLHALQRIHEHIDPQALHVVSFSGDQLQALPLQQHWAPEQQQQLQEALHAIMTEYHHRHALLVRLWNMFATLGNWIQSYATSSLVLRWHTRWLLGMEVDVPADWLFNTLKSTGNSCISYQIWRWDHVLTSHCNQDHNSSCSIDGGKPQHPQSCLCIASGVNAVSFMWQGVLAEQPSASPAVFKIANGCSSHQHQLTEAMVAGANEAPPYVCSPQPTPTTSAPVSQDRSPTAAPPAVVNSPGHHDTLPKPKKRPSSRAAAVASSRSPSPGSAPEAPKHGSKKKHKKPQKKRKQGKAAATQLDTSGHLVAEPAPSAAAAVKSGQNASSCSSSAAGQAPAPTATALVAAAAAAAPTVPARKAVLQAAAAPTGSVAPSDGSSWGGSWAGETWAESWVPAKAAAAAVPANSAGDTWGESWAPAKAAAAAFSASAGKAVVQAAAVPAGSWGGSWAGDTWSAKAAAAAAATAAPTAPGKAVLQAAAVPAAARDTWGDWVPVKAPAAAAPAATKPSAGSPSGDPKAAAAMALAQAGALASAGEAAAVQRRTTSYAAAAAAAAGKEHIGNAASKQPTAPRRISTEAPAGNTRSSRSGSSIGNSAGGFSGSVYGWVAAKGGPGSLGAPSNAYRGFSSSSSRSSGRHNNNNVSTAHNSTGRLFVAGAAGRAMSIYVPTGYRLPVAVAAPVLPAAMPLSRC